MTSETRHFSFCVLASLFINAAVLVFAGWFWRSQPTLAMAARPHIKMVTVALRRLPSPQVVKPIIAPHVKPPPVKPHPRKLRRPGARVRSTQPAPLAAPAGGSDAGAPALASPPAPPPPPVIATQRPALRVVHNIIAPPSQIPASSLAPSTVLPPPVMPVAPPAAATGTGAGGSAPGKAAGSGEGTGKGSGAGSGTSQDAGEPFGVGQGMAGDGAPRHVVYVLDISGSMTSRIDRAESELRHALNGLRPDETFNLVVFSDDARSFDDEMVPATRENEREAGQYLHMLQVGGDTNLEAAMTLALSMRDVNEVILLTDGVPHGEGETNFKKLARLIRWRNKTHARISAVGLVGKNPDQTDDSFEAAQLLQEIARDSGGTAKLVTLGAAAP